MNYNKFFSLAKEAGINESEIKSYNDYSLSFSLFHGEIDSYETSNSTGYSVRGIYNGKFGACSSDIYNSKIAKQLVDEIIKGATSIERNDPAILFKGSPKYKKINVFNDSFLKVETTKKIELLHEIETKIKAKSPLITEVSSVNYYESVSSSTFYNSYGLKLKDKGSIFSISAEAVAKSGEQIKTGYYSFIGNDYSKINVDEFVDELVKRTTEQLDGKQCNTGTYKCVLDRDVVSSLVDPYLSYASSESVQKHTSLFIGKLNTQIASKKITISDKPLLKTIFARNFDSEGVATYNKDIIKNGVLKTYLYNLTTAQKEGVETTGNAVGHGSKLGIAPFYTVIKPGKKTLEELFQKVNNGVYITDVTALHAGLNPQSGSFSLKAAGFMIENGKKTYPLDEITISGNLLDIFKDVVEVASDSEEYVGKSIPSLLIKKIKVSCK